MAFILILFGALLFITAYQGNAGTFAGMLRDDIFGTSSNHGYLYWAVAILIVGAVGYIKPLKGLSDAFIALLVIVLFLAAGTGFFSKFNSALAQISSGASAGETAPNNGALSGAAFDPTTGLPSLPTLNSLSNQAISNIANGGPL